MHWLRTRPTRVGTAPSVAQIFAANQDQQLIDQLTNQSDYLGDHSEAAEKNASVSSCGTMSPGGK